MLGNKLPDSRVVEKILVALPEKFEPTIAFLENTKDLSKTLWQNYSMHCTHKNKED